MLMFRQQYVLDGAICGSVELDGESIGEFRVDVAQWDDLREHATDDIVGVWNERQAREYDEENASEA